MPTLRERVDEMKTQNQTNRSLQGQKSSGEKRRHRVGKKATLNNVRFCQELIRAGLNAKAAYLKVHPEVTPRTAEVNGHRMLRNAEVQAVLLPMLEKLFIDAGIEADYVFKRWVEMSQASPLDYFKIAKDGKLGELDLSNLTEAQRLNLKAIKVTQTKFGETITVTVCDQARAVNMIAKHLGLLTEKTDNKDVERIGDIIEKGVARIKATKDLDGWKDMIIDGKLIL